MNPRSRQLVIFDMDGTLTRPSLDFGQIRAEIGLGEGPVLEAMENIPPGERARAQEILEAHEARAAAASELQSGAREVVGAIREFGMPVALMTRNSRRSVAALMQRHGLVFDVVRTREDGPMKPSPEPILEICEAVGVGPEDAWSVGDYHFDILCGAAAGAKTVLLLEDGRRVPEWASEADHVIKKLSELLTLVGVNAVSKG